MQKRNPLEPKREAAEQREVLEADVVALDAQLDRTAERLQEAQRRLALPLGSHGEPADFTQAPAQQGSWLSGLQQHWLLFKCAERSTMLHALYLDCTRKARAFAWYASARKHPAADRGGLARMQAPCARTCAGKHGGASRADPRSPSAPPASAA